MQKTAKPDRIDALDYLRGFFIIVIIIDHLYRWPSFLSIFTGEGLLWANASDGFIIISGLLVGYIRGRKNMKLPFKPIAVKLAQRAGMLYLWGVGVSIVLAAIQWLVTFRANMPGVGTPQGDWPLLLLNSFTLEYQHPWIYFLHLYAIFLLLAIGVVWLLRKNLAWIVAILSIIGFAIGHYNQIEWLERQVIFFIPAVAGFYLDVISGWVRSLPRKKQTLLSSAIAVAFAASITLSALWRFKPELFSSETWNLINNIFSRSPMGAGAVLTAFFWFVGLFVIFQLALPILKRYLKWLIQPFGHHSLGAYIIHGLPVLVISYFFANTKDPIANTLFGIASVLLIVGLLKIPVVRQLLPK